MVGPLFPTFHWCCGSWGIGGVRFAQKRDNCWVAFLLGGVTRGTGDSWVNITRMRACVQCDRRCARALRWSARRGLAHFQWARLEVGRYGVRVRLQAHTLMKPSFFQLACVARSPVYFFCLVFRLSQIDFFLGGKMMLLSKAPLMLIEEAAFDGMCVCVGGDRWCNTDYSELWSSTCGGQWHIQRAHG